MIFKPGLKCCKFCSKHIAHLRQQSHNLKFVIFQETTPVERASANVSFCNNNTKISNFVL